jgi:acyl-CoA thioesterase-1
MIEPAKSYGFSLTLLVAVCAVNSALSAEKPVPEAGLSERVKPAKRTRQRVDPNLPYVLIIGDSISIGYTPHVVRMLEGKANAIHARGNNAGTSLGSERLTVWLGKTKWDIIHFNWGAHDLKRVEVAGTARNSPNPHDPQQADIATYEENMKVLVGQLKATGAKLIFATTAPFTPVRKGASPFRDPEDVPRYNSVALKIMKENGIKINDLYSFALPKLKDIQRPHNVHFTREGSEVLAQQVVQTILEELGQESAAPD